MVHAKSKNSVGLGNALMNDRFGKGKGTDRKKTSAVTRTNHATGEQYIVNDHKEAAWVKMRSVTQQGALDEFLATAELAGTDFTAEKMNSIKIIQMDQRNPYLLSAAEEVVVLGKHKAYKNRLTVPRRPRWDSSTTPEELDRLEKEAFLDWRRGLAELQENNDLLMTPFERNLEVWRQLWRVIERSDLVVQIVDARNPLLFRSEDLEDYVKDVDPKKQNLLLINKADMMTIKQRRAWAHYLRGSGIAYKFFSAHLAKELNEARQDEGDDEGDDDGVLNEDDVEEAFEVEGGEPTPKDDEEAAEAEDENIGDEGEDEDEDTRILTVEELEDIFLQHAPDTSDDPERKLQVGLVGYPNVGKSSTINALIGAKKVSVSSTPGKTKHFQTIHLSDRVVLCDCPGLVFPNFATTKADLVCNGVLPIDQLREYTGPAALVAQRVPRAFLEAVYGMTIRVRPAEEGGSGVPSAEELLVAYARARGYTTKTGAGQPDESRAARVILKDYVNGKLLYCEPPPGGEGSDEFNRELYDDDHLPEKRRAAAQAAQAAQMEALSLAGDEEDGEGESSTAAEAAGDRARVEPGTKSGRLDKAFFKPGAGGAGHISRPFNHKYTIQGREQLVQRLRQQQGRRAEDQEDEDEEDEGDEGTSTAAGGSGGGRQLSGRKARTMVALELGIDPKDVQLASGKKHFKGGQKGGGKVRRRTNKLDE